MAKETLLGPTLLFFNLFTHVFYFVLVAVLVGAASAGTSEEEGKKYIEEVNQKSSVLGQEWQAKNWAANTANKADSQKAATDFDEISKKYGAYQKEVYPKIMEFPWKTFKDPNTKRMFFLESFIGEAILPDDKLAKLEKVQEDINNIDATAVFKEYQSSDDKPKLNFDDMVGKIQKDYNNVEELTYYWKERHDTVGKPIKPLFTEWLSLETEVAKLNGYKDIAEYFQAKYEMDNFENTMLDLYKQIEPLIKELHAYVRYRLWDLYGKNDKIVDLKGPISASLLGYRGEQDLSPMYDILKPYPQTPDFDITPQLKAKGYTGRKMAEEAEKFFESLGFPKLPDDFWNKSIFENKPDMNSCNSFTFDFANGKDYRLLFCKDPSTESFRLIYAFMGYLHYNMEFAKLPYLFQDSPNDDFKTAFLNVMVLISTAPSYLKSIGLLDSNVQQDKELEINILFKNALYTVFSIPWMYTFDAWRWSIAKGTITPQNCNCEYWKMVTNLQGVEPPVDRGENDFDPGVYSRFVKGDQTIRFYIGEIMKYDLLRGLCKTAGDKNDLVFCDVNNNKAVGTKLKEMMAFGTSRPWYEPYEKVTGHKNLDASALLEYYQPLQQWLEEENKKNQVTVGWNGGQNRCK